MALVYQYIHPDTQETIDVVQEVNDTHEYVDYLGVKWDRVFSSNMAVGLKIDPFSKNQFLDKTRGGGTMGDLLDRAAELSAMRAEKRDGIDPVKEKADEEYSKARKGRKPPKNFKDAVASLG